MPFHESAVCSVSLDQMDGGQIDTKEKLIEKCIIREFIQGKDLCEGREHSESYEKEGDGGTAKKSTRTAGDAVLYPESLPCFIKEETIISTEIPVISDYGDDLLCYRLFCRSLCSCPGENGIYGLVAEEGFTPVRCRGKPDTGSVLWDEKGYGIEISHLRRNSHGLWDLKDYLRAAGITGDLDRCRLFFRRLTEGRVYPCSLPELLEDYSEMF